MVADGPLLIMMIRSDNSTASSTSWVIMMTVFLSAVCISISESCIWVRVSESRAPKGSSISNTLGSMASALAMPTRCFMPPDISSGLRSSACDMCTRSRLCLTQS